MQWIMLFFRHLEIQLVQQDVEKKIVKKDRRTARKVVNLDSDKSQSDDDVPLPSESSCGCFDIPVGELEVNEADATCLLRDITFSEYKRGELWVKCLELQILQVNIIC